MSRSESGFGGSFSVDGSDVEVDLAEFGWPGDRSRAEDASDDAPEDDGRVRLQKALAHAGIASRRACETLITSGRVTVNGEPQLELGSRIDPATDEVRVDGVVVQLDASKRYFVLNKPTGVVSTMSDEHGRPDLREFTDRVEDRLYNVGRLDTDTSGLLILTNDGELAHKLAHPSFGVQKTYIAKVRGRVTAAAIQQLKDGVELSDGPIHADRAKLLPGGSGKSHSLVELTIHSGRNRIVRRMLAEVGHPVVELVRRQFGPLHLGTLRVGEMRELAPAERGALLSADSVDDTTANGDGAGSGERGRGTAGARGARRPVTSGRPGDGKGARGMRGIAAKGNPHGRRSAESSGDDRVGGPRSAGSRPGTSRSGGPREDRGGRGEWDARGGREDRDERGGRPDRDERGGRDGRGGHFDRDERGGRPDRDRRGERGDRDGRDGRIDRDYRGGRDDRDVRGGRDVRGDRFGRGGASARDERSTRDARGGRDEHYGRDERFGRDERPGRERRSDDRRFDAGRGGRGDATAGGRSARANDSRARGGRDAGREGGRDGGFRGGRDSGFDRSRGSRDGGFDRSRGEREAGRDGGFDRARGSREGGFDRARGEREAGRDGGFDRSRGSRAGGFDRARGERDGTSSSGRRDPGARGFREGDRDGGFRGGRDRGFDRSYGDRSRDDRAHGSRDHGDRSGRSRIDGSRTDGSGNTRDEHFRGSRVGSTERGRGNDFRTGRDGGRDGDRHRGPRGGQQKRGDW